MYFSSNSNQFAVYFEYMMIRKTELKDLDEVMAVYEHGRQIMRNSGNLFQCPPVGKDDVVGNLRHSGPKYIVDGVEARLV